MSDGESPMKDVVDATAPIADAVVREAWPYKKVLLAVLPPTLALLSVFVGVWDNGNRDRRAQAEADKNRVAAAEEAEATRKAEVKKDQDAADTAQRRQVAELVLPRYEALLADVHATMDVADPCLEALNRYLKESNVPAEISGSVDFVDPPTTPYIVPPSDLRPFPVSAAVFETCKRIEPTFDPLELSLDKALLVSNPALEKASTELVAQMQSLSQTAQVLLDQVLPDVSSPTGYSIEVGGPGVGYLPDGAPLDLFVWRLNHGLSALADASQGAINAARVVVLEQG